MINWTLRLQNKVTLTAICGAFVSLVFKVMAIAGVAVSFTQSDIMETIDLCIVILMALGIVTDPTTSGLADSERAMSYERPNYADDECDEDGIVEEEESEEDPEEDEVLPQ